VAGGRGSGPPPSAIGRNPNAQAKPIPHAGGAAVTTYLCLYFLAVMATAAVACRSLCRTRAGDQ